METINVNSLVSELRKLEAALLDADDNSELIHGVWTFLDRLHYSTVVDYTE